jgi:hypothetical protein
MGTVESCKKEILVVTSLIITGKARAYLSGASSMNPLLWYAPWLACKHLIRVEVTGRD